MRPPRSTPGSGPPPIPAPMARGRRAHAGPPAADEAATDSGPAPEAPPTRAGRSRLRPRTVRAKIVCLLMVPVVSLLALWAYATVTTAQDVARLRQAQQADSTVRDPLTQAVAALQAERVAAVGYTGEPAADGADELKRLGATTDRAVAALRLGRGNTVADGADLPHGVAARLETFVRGAEQLRAVRTAVLERRAGWDTAYGQYTKAIGAAFTAQGALAGVQDPARVSDARVLLEFGRSAEMLAREDALLTAARPAGSLDGERLRLFVGAVDTRRALIESAATDLRGPERAAWNHLAEGSAYGDVRAVEDRTLIAPPGRKALAAAPAATWDSAHAAVQDGMRGIESDAARSAADRADPFTRVLLTPAGAAVLFGLVAVAASLVISVRIGRGLVVELISLRNSALEIARRKLPHAMRKLRAGEEIDIRAEAPQGPPAEDETGQVSEALTTVHRAALHAAVERAELASGISGVFVNLARRSQVLVHRQLGLLDSMERRADDPSELGDLFRLDHLTTRMRRHAESLIILSGAAPGRAWRMPVPLTNVVRAAISEIEDYARVEVRNLAAANVAGAAVADLTHLLAELVENAAQFSPPHTKVRISGEPVGNGYAIEIEDRGLGMGKETLDEANDRIQQSEALDLFDSDRLGLFVVSRLAHRHDIQVHLRTSPYGGTTAVVLLPTSLLHKDGVETGETPHPPSDEERRYARVPEPEAAPMNGNPVPAPAPRPALAASAAPPPEETPHPPGVTTLRLRKPPSTDGDEGADTGGLDTGGLPRRVRQASLAPQLRTRPEEQTTPARRVPEPGERTPEQARARMASFRDGWARGGGRPPGRDSSGGDLT
ncbi:nitrate- and nitrite sensing domain-containing protein [Streptomyces sp. VRA16 Mangrove soil]|uniref:sensor histidine kinase n=1 Tax=Streptomyces sp. VRA16 Mangrove soil TaxID=2817434 RepID=UPI001A9FD544|nr:nitrate- and nitrite sensing domain-containing protein [Streptomyces sp. VRA16 Mangrove soil]MBO1332351.1 nitrate- and nitrite sensing domain-containing protein [Streptomyces sp. VRA16 Mangrove soil]